MGVKVRFWKRAWWLVIHHEGRRKRKCVGDRETALRMAKAIRERMALGALNLAPPPEGQTLAAYARVWLTNVGGTLKASTLTFYTGHLDNQRTGARRASGLGNQASGLPGADCVGSR